MKLSKISSAAVLSAGFLTASATQAQTPPTLIGGGSSLVSPSILQESSIFPAADGTISYFINNSGVGQTAFLTNNASGFGTTDTVDFANSDSALTPFQITTYDTGLGVTDGPLIQIPYIVTPITIPVVVAPTGTGPALPLDPAATPTVALNDNDLCGIFSGRLTNWSQVTNPDTISSTNTSGTPYSLNSLFKVVYSSDNSGITELLTRHLSVVCHDAADVAANPSLTLNSNVDFVDGQAFAANFPSSTPPTNFIPESGSAGVANELRDLQTENIAAIAYLSPDFTNKFLATSTLAPAATNSLSVASLVNANLLPQNPGNNSNDVIPTAAEATAALAMFAPPGIAANSADPSNPANWVPFAANPTAGYPVSGTSNIIVSQCYANPVPNTPTPAQAVIDFLNDHYNNASFGSIITANGFNTVPSNYQTQIIADFLSSSRGSTNTLNIENASVCKGTVVGR